MADKKTSEENALAKSGITLNTAIRLADGSTGDNYQISLFDLADVITLTSADAITLLSTPNAIMQGSDYKITSLGITGVSHVIISGRNMIQGFSPAEALVTSLGVYVPCTYDVATNKLSCILVTEGIFYGGETPSFVIEKSSTIGKLSVVENSNGDWFINSTENDFPVNKTSCVVGSLAATTAISFAADIILIAAQRDSDNKIRVVSVSGVIGAYDYIGEDGIRIEIHINVGNL